MQPLDQQELIEQYLSGALPEAQLQEVETRMTQDASFRAQVELQRQLHAEFADPKKLALRDMLSEITQETPTSSPSFNRWWIIGLIAGALGVAAWYFWPQNAPTESRFTPPVIAPTVPDQPTQQAPPAVNEPIAKATGPAFRVNPAFESRLGKGGIRSGSSEEVKVKQPAANADFAPQNGNVSLKFMGTVPPEGDLQSTPLQINVYNNQPNSNPVLSLQPKLTEQADKWQFDITSKARLAPGVYYYTLEWTETGDLAYVGKFTVGAK